MRLLVAAVLMFTLGACHKTHGATTSDGLPVGGANTTGDGIPAA